MLPLIGEKIKTEDRYSAIKSRDFPPGAAGRPVILKDNLKIHIQDHIRKGWEEHSFNKFVSDLIPLNRSLPDFRDSWCEKKTFKNLPTATVIITFYNEAWSTLMRTVYSVLCHSPEDILIDIILVDDYSTKAHLKVPLEKYIETLPKVKLIRTVRREGIAKARILGTKRAKSSIVVFLDSHCECTPGWLEPLLERIYEDPTRVVSPVIDVIHPSTFEYIGQDVDELLIGGFTWGLKFTWISIPHEIYNKRENKAAPLRTPTISGGLFAIDKNFFQKLGFYDDGFNIWGADNLELSFKTWMCGGSLEIVPCSHVGHIFRNKFPYEVPQSTIRMNHIRLAKVWLDDYAKYFYERMGNKVEEVGDITKMKELRQKLHCKNFGWYLKNVYPQMKIPDMHVACGQAKEGSSLNLIAGKNCFLASLIRSVMPRSQHIVVTVSHSHLNVNLGRPYHLNIKVIEIRQIQTLNYDGYCLDTDVRADNLKESVNLNICHGHGGNQYWIYTKHGEIQRDGMCLDYLFHSVMLYLCRGRSASQIWVYNNKSKQIMHQKTRKCLTATHRSGESYKVILQICIKSYSQTWAMERYKPERLKIKLTND